MSIETNTYDVIVVGSGAGAMLAAARAHDLGLSVLVVEKSDKYGGTSAVSGGAVWIPNNSQMQIKDSFDEALTYLKAATQGLVAEDRLLAYLESAPQMVEYINANMTLQYFPCHRYPDYYQHLPGAKPGGRTMEPMLFDAALLGDEFANLRMAYTGTLLMGKASMTATEAHVMLAKEPGWMLQVIKSLGRYYLDLPWRLKSRHDRKRGLGNAMAAGLRHALLERKVPLWLNTPFESLITEGAENKRVTGIVVKRNGQTLQLTARRGVVLGAGGFERNQQMREQYLPKPTNAAWSATPPHNTGDTIRAAMDIGARAELMDWAWWVPSIHVPGEAAQTGLFAERNLPGCIVVNGKGQRFINEASPYLEFGAAMYENHARSGSAVPAWLIFDGKFRYNYPMGPLMPGQIQPDRKAWLGKVYWRDDTLEGLAKQIGVDAAGLKQSVELNNQYAQDGKDREFDKGGNVFDRYYGDYNVKPNPCLAPIGKPPYYAMRVDAGDIGTKGGLLTDKDARVLDESDRPIEGLYCIGNNSASVMGKAYPGAGGTLGPAMTFGFRAANHIAASK
ncbi:3-oxosteroid 1-dehydrogenase [Sterolibacterium denitrificans]|uniref:3-oxosteroid 1-dehydrogenase n=1 Tax=Sterolibacterium denitrificans TaxID=157592 RepID=A9XWD7_9PROT|nr:FAD-binding protein [Sterolibacterium denitrificans]ABV59992.1 cholest-4-en-3-one-delta1-dehydrogenase [Sterolibacterium denitrificans]7P18_A Chain A, 3-oxosteroid 1-dehydrogenase [Sterolibacterium denitrificans]7P18_B Chain B, 3-oxosteroid 1-dehydrogenase [Sterolibacterium denitrificans]SMB22076.1 3-oxosteroid 1-dehydrogenase [Sterolibacterium denitrificans]